MVLGLWLWFRKPFSSTQWIIGRMGYPDNKSTEAGKHCELVFFKQWPWFFPGEPHPSKMGELVSKRRIFQTLVNSGWGVGLTGAPALWVMRGWERGWGLASLPMTCWCHSASCLPCLLNFLAVQWEILWLQFLPTRCKGHPGWMGRDAKLLLTAPSASWIHWGRRTTPHPFLPDLGWSCTALLFNTLSSFVRAFLPRSKHLWIPWLQSLSSVIWEPKENKICHCFHCFPICLPWSDKIRCHDLHFLNAEF